MNVLFTGIFNKMGTAGSPTAFYTAIGGRLYLNKAPQEATFPYVVFFLITNDDELDFSDENKIALIQFNIFTENNSATSAGTILGHQEDLYNDCDLTVSGWRHLSMDLDFIAPNNDLTVVPPIMGYSSQYTIELEKVKS